MRSPSRRRLRQALVILGIVALLAVSAVPGFATGPVGFSSTTLARGTDQSAGTLVFQWGTDVVVSSTVIEVGGNSGWHSHPGGAIVVVKQGEVTVHRATGASCDVQTFTAGQAFIERPSDTLIAVNTAAIQTIVIATFPGVPVGGSARIDRPNPGSCPGV